MSSLFGAAGGGVKAGTGTGWPGKAVGDGVLKGLAVAK
jgi:hypothetical protein